MTGQEMERAIEFLIEHHARIEETQGKTETNLGSLMRTVVEFAESVSRLEAQAESDRQEMRDAIDKLILSNEVTRDFANQIANLAIATSQRVTALEEKLA